MIENEIQYLITAREKMKFDFAIKEAEQFLVNEPMPLCGFQNNKRLLIKLSLDSMRSVRDELAFEMDEYDYRENPEQNTQYMILQYGRFWPQQPRVKDVRIKDFAHALARINRFNGSVIDSYSVAQHSYYVSRLVKREHALFGLLHDAAESIIGDVITPVKNIFREHYESIESGIMKVIAEAFGFSMDDEAKKDVKRADLIMLYAEMRDLTTLNFPGVVLHEPLKERIEPWSVAKSEEMFLRRFEELI